MFVVCLNSTVYINVGFFFFCLVDGFISSTRAFIYEVVVPALQIQMLVVPITLDIHFYFFH